MTLAIDLGSAQRRASTPADERVVDAELTALALQALLRGAGVAVDLSGIARIGMDEDELADVVQQRRDHQPVTRLDS